jgi:hypothetical protein
VLVFGKSLDEFLAKYELGIVCYLDPSILASVGYVLIHGNKKIIKALKKKLSNLMTVPPVNNRIVDMTS